MKCVKPVKSTRAAYYTGGRRGRGAVIAHISTQAPVDGNLTLCGRSMKQGWPAWHTEESRPRERTLCLECKAARLLAHAGTRRKNGARSGRTRDT